MVKRAKAKPKVDYRHRWPTQQTLVDSRVSLEASRSKWRWKFRVGWLRRLNRRSSPEPGKSTHPYDTGIGEQESGSGSGSRPASTLGEDDQRCWKLFTRMPHSQSSPAPVPKFSHTFKEEPRPETPRTPVQFLRHLTGPKKSPLPRPPTASSFDCDKPTVKCTKATVQTPDLQPKFSHIMEESRPKTPRTPVFLRHLAGPKKSPLPRPRTASSFDCDKPTVKCTKTTVQTPDLQQKATRAVAKRPKTLSVKFKSFVKNIFRRRSPDQRRTARSLTRQNKGDRNLTPVRVRRPR